MALVDAREQLGRAVRSPTTLSRAGLAGAVAMAVGSYWTAAIPVYFRRDHHLPVISLLPLGSPIASGLYYLGEAALLLAWLQLGRLSFERRAGTDWRSLRRTGLQWMVPLSLAAPIGSRDVWAYAAQGQLLHHGLDPYSLGPSALANGFTEEVSHRWISTPAPYGPLWMMLGRGIATVIGNHVTVTVIALRVVAVLGALLIAWAVPILAERAGGRPDLAVWFAVANPLLLVLGVGGAHNDVLMVGLMVAGLAVATGPGSIWRSLVLGTVLITGAAAIKSPAVVAAAFAVPLWLAHAPSARTWRDGRAVLRACLLVAVVAVVSFLAITWASGVGFGWIKQVNSDAVLVSWLSIPTGLAMLVKAIEHGTFIGGGQLDHTTRTFRTVGTVVTVVALIGTWLLALRRNPWVLLAGAFGVVVALGPSVLVWYLCWPFTIAAVVIARRRSVIAAAATTVVCVATMKPNGYGELTHLPGLPIAIAAIAVALLVLRPIRETVDEPVRDPV
jgi:hypothetical protein